MHNVFKSKEGMYYHILLIRLEVDYDVVLAGGGNGGGAVYLSIGAYTGNGSSTSYSNVELTSCTMTNSAVTGLCLE